MTQNLVKYCLHDTLDFGFHPFHASLTSITYDCDSTTIYYLVTSNENNMVVTYIYFLDIKNKNIRLFCRQPYIYGICSLEEFKTSRCILSIDLDEDDSTIRGILKIQLLVLMIKSFQYMTMTYGCIVMDPLIVCL